MRSTLIIAAALTAGLAGLPGGVPAQTDRPAIEESPLAPIAPRLPGGTVVTPETRSPLPGGIVVPPAEGAEATPEGATAPDRPAGEAPTAAAGQAPTEAPDAAADEAPADGSMAGPDSTAPGAAAGAATATLPEGEAPPTIDLFKRAPPGMGGLGPQSPQPIDAVARRDAPGAVLRQLDKLTGRIDTFELAAGAETTVERLRIALTECRLPADGTTANHIAFLRVWDTRRADAEPVFSGWMFADSPALSAMDHPRYDLWVIRCMTAAGSASEAKR